MGSIIKDRYIAVALVALVVCVSSVTAAYAYMHVTGGVTHGLEEVLLGCCTHPFGKTNANGALVWTDAEVRHYNDDGSYNLQCNSAGWYSSSCQGSYGSQPCHKRYVGGAEGMMARHWVRGWTSCPGQLHA